MSNWLTNLWYGQSKSRLDMGKFARPDGWDYERVVEEMGKVQREILNQAANSGSIFITDIVPQDEDNEEVSSKVFIDVAGQTVLASCITSSRDIIITIHSTFPMCKIEDTTFELDASTDTGHYSKSVNYTLRQDAVDLTVSMVLPNETLGTSYTTTLEIVAGPTLLTLHFLGGYPGSQTEVKEGDTFQLTGTTDVPCVAVRIADFGACVASIQTFPSTNTFVVTGTVDTTGYTTQALAASVQARNAAGAYGPVRLTNVDGSDDGYHTIKCNDTRPTFIDNGFTNESNPGALAFKGIEAGVQDTTVAAFDTIVYSSPHGDFVIANDTTYEKIKDIACVNPGDYNDSNINFRITATRTANGYVSVFDKTIEVADIAPLLTVTQADSRLRSENEHIITVISNQNLDTAPNLNIVVGGTWQGASFVATPNGQKKIWTRSLLVENDDARGTSAWTQFVPATNQSGYNATITGNCVIGGFESISVVFDHTPDWPLEPISDLVGVSCLPANPEKLVCYDNSGHLLTYQSNKLDIAYRFTIVDAGGNLSDTGNYIYWCDLDAVAANATGTAYLTLEETV